jgi:probable HAF family extracellular repeat protein/YD repeat-containing protein
MTFSTRTRPGRGLRLAVAGGVLLTALATATATAAPATPMGVSALERPRLGTAASATPSSRTGPATTPRTPIPGFLLERGRYTKFDAPDAVQQTNPLGINNRGVIVGKHTDAAGVDHGFRRDARGRFVTIDFPGGVPTQLNKINDRGQIVGRYATIPGVYSFRGFLLTDGRLVTLDVPGARYTQPLGINNRGQVVGEYQTPDGRTHGFRWERGRFTTIDKPGAPATSLIDINDRGQILGATADPADPAGLASLRPFVLDRGRFVSFRAPDAPITFPYDLNNRGQVVGYTAAPTATDPVAGARGFLLARGARGPFTPIDVPDAPRTIAYGLNDAGAIVGQYENTAATPSPQPTAAMPMGLMPLPQAAP